MPWSPLVKYCTFLKSSETDPTIGLVLIAIGVELEYRSIASSLSGQGPKGELNAPIIVESEIVNFLRLLKLIRRLDSSMIAIGVESEFTSVTRSLSGWSPKGEPNAPIAAESKVTDSLKLICRSDSSMIAFGVESECKSVARSLSGWSPKEEHNASIAARSEVVDFLRWRHSCIYSSGLL
jgi:hypothetical protein